MPLKLMYITNKPEIAVTAEKNTVDRIWIDLEWRGKAERQYQMNTVKSNHVPEDIDKIRSCLSKAQLMVRVNPLFDGSKAEIGDVIDRGAELVMLPMFRSADDAARFVDIVNGRAKTMLLVETADAERDIEKIVQVPGIDEIHIGLNDLHLEHRMKFMFELLSGGNVEAICSAVRKAGIPYGFGGIAKLNEGALPAKHIIAEHYRLGSGMAILSRSFYDSSRKSPPEEAERVFRQGMREIREYEDRLNHETAVFFEENRALLQREVGDIVAKLSAGK